MFECGPSCGPPVPCVPANPKEFAEMTLQIRHSLPCFFHLSLLHEVEMMWIPLGSLQIWGATAVLCDYNMYIRFCLLFNKRKIMN